MSSAPIALVTALREELRTLESTLESRRTVKSSLRYQTARLNGVEVVLAVTGIGRRNAALKTKALLDEVEPARLIATGFAGGLNDDLAPGDLLVAAEVKTLPSPREDRTEPEGSPQTPWQAPGELVALATSMTMDGARVRSGTLLTVDKVLSRPTEKRSLGLTHAADAVDMESSAVVLEASRRGVSALCARAILDEVDYELPFDFGKILTEEGNVRPIRALATVAANPRGLLRIDHLRSRARRASATLAAFLPRLVEVLAQSTP